jgi:hypothetical protein
LVSKHKGEEHLKEQVENGRIIFHVVLEKLFDDMEQDRFK